jgi:dTDP-4-dehydrorhamnose reductase
MLVNTLLPQFIAKNGFNSKIIHITTDCVYDGVKGNYDENDEVSATDVYGITKYCG